MNIEKEIELIHRRIESIESELGMMKMGFTPAIQQLTDLDTGPGTDDDKIEGARRLLFPENEARFLNDRFQQAVHDNKMLREHAVRMTNTIDALRAQNAAFRLVVKEANDFLDDTQNLHEDGRDSAFQLAIKLAGSLMENPEIK